MAEDAEDAAMTDAAPATDAFGRLIGEAHTSGRLRGADMLDASEAASSLFASVVTWRLLRRAWR